MKGIDTLSGRMKQAMPTAPTAGIWVDIGCSDFKAAAESRQRQKDKHYLIWWLWYESFVRAYPRNKPLPEWLSLGKLPSINKNERNNLNQYGVYEIGDDGLIEADNFKRGINE